jgi:5-methylcytosine-specific restriction enzyme A
MRNPKWHRDEIILALDLYFSANRGSIDDKNRNVQELSKVLNDLPLFPDRPDEVKFRNANGVTLKLTNFSAFDPDYKGKGMTGGSKLDKAVFDEFSKDKNKLRAIADEIRSVAANDEVKKKIYAIEEDEQSKSDSVMEGQVLYKLHKVRERDNGIVILKKKQTIDLTGKLACEACVFEFENFYGDIGKGFIECHHRVPLSNFKVASKTTLDDLSLVCSNCHRMLHKSIDTISVDDLRMMIRYDKH